MGVQDEFLAALHMDFYRIVWAMMLQKIYKLVHCQSKPIQG
jgi:hypothetical protein